MNNGTDWQNQFSQGFSSGGDNSGFIWVFLLILAALIGAVFAYDYYRKNTVRTRKPAPKVVASRPAAPGAPLRLQPAGKLNPLQMKVLHEMIDEFRKQETSARAVPSAVLEKFSEFFYQNVKRLKASDADVANFVNRNYPIQAENSVELDFHIQGSLHLIKSKVLEVGPRTLTVAFTGAVPAFIKKNTPLFINYSSGQNFLQGSTWISEIQEGYGLVLRKPVQIELTSERRYARVVLDKVAGIIHDPRTGYQTPVKVLDLSLEGLRIQVEKPLEKSHVYQLKFEGAAGGKAWPFGPIECAPSKAFVTGSGAYESGLVFLYLDMNTKARLNAFMKSLAQEMMERKESQ